MVFNHDKKYYTTFSSPVEYETAAYNITMRVFDIEINSTNITDFIQVYELHEYEKLGFDKIDHYITIPVDASIVHIKDEIFVNKIRYFSYPFLSIKEDKPSTIGLDIKSCTDPIIPMVNEKYLEYRECYEYRKDEEILSNCLICHTGGYDFHEVYCNNYLDATVANLRSKYIKLLMAFKTEEANIVYDMINQQLK